MSRSKDKLSRRKFIKISAGVAAGMASLPGALRAGGGKPKRKATDIVTLGESGIRVSRLGMGTGTISGRVQRELGQEKFSSLVRHALDRGITFFDTADGYNEMHEMLRTAIKGVDRDKIQIQSKISWSKYDDPLKEIDRFRTEVGTDYFDSFLIHCVMRGDWVENQKRLMDFLDEAKEKQVIKARGVSMHGLEPLIATSTLNWGDVRLVRINHNGSNMDKLRGEEVDVNGVVSNIKKMHDAGKGIIGMKLIGNGDFTDPQVRQESIKFVMGLDCVDSVIIGFKSPEEIDEAINNMNKYLS